MTRLALTLIVPLYNGRPHIEALLPTIRSQIGDLNQCIFIDDVSSDDTVSYVESYDLDRTTIVKNVRNIGLYGSLNMALSLVDTDLTALIFQDDVLNPSFAREMMDLAARRPDASFFTAGFARLDAAGRTIDSTPRTGREWTKSPSVASWGDVLLSGSSWIISGSVSRTSVLRRYGFRPDLPQCGDFDFFARAVRQERFVYLDKTLIGIREHPAQASVGNLARSIDFSERIEVLRTHRRLWPGDFTPSLKVRLCIRYCLDLVARSLGQLRRGRAKPCRDTIALLCPLIAALWGPTRNASLSPSNGPARR